MRRLPPLRGTLPFALALVLVAGTVASGSDLPKYADQQEERLKELDTEVIDAQMARFRAIFAKDKDEEEIERLDEKFKKIQKKRRELLKSTGKVY